MSRMRALKSLVKVRQRRGEALDQAVTGAVRTHEDAKATEQDACDQVESAQSAEDAVRRKLSEMLDVGQTFDANMITVREHQITVMAGKVVEAQGEVERCAAEAERCMQEVRAKRAEAARNRQKIDAMKGDIAKLLAERQQAEDDEQDEEAEEAAISRLIANARQAAEAAQVAER